MFPQSFGTRRSSIVCRVTRVVCRWGALSCAVMRNVFPARPIRSIRLSPEESQRYTTRRLAPEPSLLGICGRRSNTAVGRRRHATAGARRRIVAIRLGGRHRAVARRHPHASTIEESLWLIVRAAYDSAAGYRWRC